MTAEGNFLAARDFTEQVLWEKLIINWLAEQGSELENSIFYASTWQLAAQAKQAWELLASWNIPIVKVKDYGENLEVAAFIAWAHKYEKIGTDLNLTKNNKLDPAFDFQNNKIINNCCKLACQDFRDQLENAAKWANHHLPLGSVGVIVPDLATQYGQIDYLFSNFIARNKYILGIGDPPHTLPIMQTAFLILKLANCYIAQELIEFQDFSFVLRSSALAGWNMEAAARAHMDDIFRDNLESKFSWQFLKKNLLEYNNKYNFGIKIFLTIWDNLEKFLIAQAWKVDRSKFNTGSWVEMIKKILAIVGWGQNFTEPGQKFMDLWQSSLENYLGLDQILLEHDLPTALVIINRSLKYADDLRRTQQLIDPSLQQIKILNVAQALNLTLNFDYVWIADLTEMHWPIQEQRNPFLPSLLQKKYEKLANANKYLIKLINLAKKQVICSYPHYLENDPVRASHLIKDLPEILATELGLTSPACLSKELQDHKLVTNIKLTNSHSNLEYYLDILGSADPRNTFSGTSFLKEHLACPFKAHAKFRLSANKLNFPKAYLSKAIKGEILHATLAKFWDKYKDLKKVQELTAQAMSLELTKIAKKVLADLQILKPYSLGKVRVELEAARVAHASQEFIKKYDLPRAPFKIWQIEFKTKVALKEFFLNIKIDRIDQLADQKFFIIDYKTGSANLSLATIFDLDDPQLLIYALAVERSALIGLSLALIKNSKDLKLIGILKDQTALYANIEDSLEQLGKLGLPQDLKFKILPDFSEVLGNFQQQLYIKLQEFKQGLATVEPKYGKVTCRTCDLHAFCRINI